MGFLSDVCIRAAKPKDKAYKLFDTRGLYLKVSTSGARLWRFKYSLHGRERLLALGQYPDVSLGRAREKRDAARHSIADGIDPAVQRLVDKTAKADTFAVIAAEWLELQRKRFAPATTMEKAEWTFRDLINPYIGNRPIAEIMPLELLNVFRRLEARGKHETAHRTMQRCGQLFRYAVATGRATRDPTQDLRGALAPVVTRHHAAITDPRRVGELLRALHGYVGLPMTEAALKLAPLVFVRPGELRKAEWVEFDLGAGEWRIPAQRMKMRQQHAHTERNEVRAAYKRAQRLPERRAMMQAWADYVDKLRAGSAESIVVPISVCSTEHRL
jgi:integrase